jgi:hypothetical protein
VGTATPGCPSGKAREAFATTRNLPEAIVILRPALFAGRRIYGLAGSTSSAREIAQILRRRAPCSWRDGRLVRPASKASDAFCHEPRTKRGPCGDSRPRLSGGPGLPGRSRRTRGDARRNRRTVQGAAGPYPNQTGKLPHPTNFLLHIRPPICYKQ